MKLYRDMTVEEKKKTDKDAETRQYLYKMMAEAEMRCYDEKKLLQFSVDNPSESV